MCGATGRFTWALRVDVGRDERGRRRRERGGGYTTREAAERAMREMLGKVDSATYVQPSELTLAAYLEGEWLPATAPPQVSWGTYRKRRDLLSAYVVPRIGGVPLQGPARPPACGRLPMTPPSPPAGLRPASHGGSRSAPGDNPLHPDLAARHALPSAEERGGRPHATRQSDRI